jgi:hypothetical protein
MYSVDKKQNVMLKQMVAPAEQPLYCKFYQNLTVALW